ncbi:DUF2184 domain-containing protein [Caulobacter hibisci]|uniref:DUF2184 domain-containing protein n=1 Tax=Caulobacter hibisci TaxID=2035993 RepID=A0ABS0STU6_9CAUL|nr:DUF2184 domain-containing protein [Caulobacter hibisci]MBI1682380.1 DUF2184 domain-containing protein [Caulobacter hibisci]
MFHSQINFADAQQAVGFLTPQLLRINTEVDMQKYPSFDYARLLFVDTDGGMWSRGSIFYSGDIAGKPEWFAGGAFDIPYADISTTQFLQENHLKALGYQWFRQELEQAAQMGRNLGNEKAAACRKVAEANIYAMTIRGDATKGLTGIVNNPNVPTATVPADGTGAATAFSTKTADQINRDINEILNAPYNASGETQRANTLLLPTTRLQSLASTRIGTGTDTVLKFIQENNSYTLETKQPLTIIGTRELETAGGSGTARMMAYDNEKDVLRLYLPGPHELFPAWQKGAFTWEVPGLFNYGGVEFRRPKGAAYRDGI